MSVPSFKILTPIQIAPLFLGWCTDAEKTKRQHLMNYYAGG